MIREVKILVDLPTGWDEEDFQFLMERLHNELRRELIKGTYSIEEIKK